MPWHGERTDKVGSHHCPIKRKNRERWKEGQATEAAKELVDKHIVGFDPGSKVSNCSDLC